MTRSSSAEKEELTTDKIRNAMDECIDRGNTWLRKHSRNEEGSTLRLRRASRKSDAPTISRLIQSLADYVKESDAVKATADMYIRDGLNDDDDGSNNNPMFQCLLLDNVVPVGRSSINDDDEDAASSTTTPCGIAFFYLTYSTWEGRCIHLDDLYIDESFRGRGGGKCIMHTLTDVALGMGCQRFVWNVLSWNTRARKFYDDIGSNTLPEWLTVRLEGEKIDAFLKQRENKGGEVVVKSSVVDRRVHEDVLTVEKIREAIDECIGRTNNHMSQDVGKSNAGPSSTTLRLRRAEKDDVSSIMDLVKGLAVFEKEPDAVRTTEETFLLDGFGTNPLFHCILVEDVVDGGSSEHADTTTTTTTTTCGMGFFYLGYSSWEGRFLYLEDLFIEEKYRGVGGGKALMYTLADISAQLDCPRFVWQVLDWNKPARDFYDNMGARTLPESWLTVRLEKDAMIDFLKSRDDIMS